MGSSDRVSTLGLASAFRFLRTVSSVKGKSDMYSSVLLMSEQIISDPNPESGDPRVTGTSGRSKCVVGSRKSSQLKLMSSSRDGLMESKDKEGSEKISTGSSVVVIGNSTVSSGSGVTMGELRRVFSGTELTFCDIEKCWGDNLRCCV